MSCLAARDYLARSYRRLSRQRRRQGQDTTLLLAAGAVAWLLILGLASSWALQGGA